MKGNGFLKIFSSLLIVGLGQPAWVGWLAPLAAAGGYALFWDSLTQVQKRKKQFWLALIWFSFVQSIQLSWMTSIEFQGYYILAVYTLVSLGLGLQFGLLSLFVVARQSLSIPRILAIAALWTLMEWGRFHIVCGFSWNPIGMALTSYPLGMQLAAVGGVLGLSFWVMLTNLWCFKARLQNYRRKTVLLWLGFAVFPYLFGMGTFAWHEKTMQKYGTLRALLVQPGLLPSQKVPLEGRIEEFVSPWNQWRSIFAALKPHLSHRIDMIALPESAVPHRLSQTVYSYTRARDLIIQEFGPEAVKAFPDPIIPFASQGRVSNAFFGQFLANYFRTDVIIGMDDEDQGGQWYSAAIHFSPWKDRFARYEKRILVPLAEYLPFAWCQALTKPYGIESFYTHGEEAKIFSGPVPLSVSICYEETFPNLVREGRLKGALLFVNVTNDNWYPDSKLAEQHFGHGRIRAVENGVSVLRACNSGVTAAVDAFGRTVGRLDARSGVLSVEVPTFHFATLYTTMGDALIVGICFGILAFYLIFRSVLDKKNSRP